MTRKEDTDFEAELYAEICERVCQGETLDGICRSDPKFPSSRAVRRNLVKSYRDAAACMVGVVPLHELYERAREMQADTFADEIIDLANVPITGDKGRDSIAVNRARLQVDARKWACSKLRPDLYGDKVLHTGPGGRGGIEIIVRRYDQLPYVEPVPLPAPRPLIEGELVAEQTRK